VNLPTPVEAHAHLHPWSLQLPVTIALAIAVLVYLRAWFSLRRQSPNVVPVWRVVAFLGGVSSVWIAVASPLAALDHQLLTIHMLKHLLLMAVGAPLILLGTVTLPSLDSLPKSPGRSPNLVLCWLAGTTTVIGWHFPAAFQLALQSPRWHAAEQVSFLLAGLLFWWPVVQSRPGSGQRWSVPLYLFLATLPCDILSAFLAFCGRVVYPSYFAAQRLLDLSPLQDQECAGALMWVSVTFIYLIPAVIITVQILSPGGQTDASAAQT
jgi:putative membrane protein